jgi:hypothetical protein
MDNHTVMKKLSVAILRFFVRHGGPLVHTPIGGRNH